MKDTNISIKDAAFILISKEGKMLLQHRTCDAPIYPDIWGLFGGKIEAGETPEEGVMREAMEELQIIPKLSFFKSYNVKESNGVHEIFVFIGPLEHSIEELKRLQQEGDGLGLFYYDELKNIKVIEDILDIANDMFRNKRFK